MKKLLTLFIFTFNLISFSVFAFDNRCFDPETLVNICEKIKSDALKGDPEAQYELYLMYMAGRGVEKSSIDEYKWLLKSASQGHTKAQYRLGLHYKFNEELLSGKDSIHQLFKKPYEIGADEKLNSTKEQAITWFSKSAEKGDSNAQKALGDAYSNGYGVKKDYSKAKKWYIKSAAQGNQDSMRSLYFMYSLGRGVEKNFDIAHKWSSKTSSAKKPYLGLSRTLDSLVTWGSIEYKKYDELYRTLKNKATEGEVESQYKLGLLYHNGKGVTKNDYEAAKWLKLAAEKGHTQSQYYLGTILLETNSNNDNKILAFKWLKAAAQKGHILAQFTLGEMYKHGLGVAEDTELAFNWYNKSAQQGYKVAQLKLGECFEKGIGTKVNYVMAYKFYHEAATQNDSLAQLRLGYLYFYGNGIKRDKNQAKTWFLRASENGNTEAQYILNSNLKNLQLPPSPSSYLYETVIFLGIAFVACLLIGLNYFKSKNFRKAASLHFQQ